MPLEKAIPWRRPRNAGLVAALLVVICAIVVAAMPGKFMHGLAVFSRPTAFVPVQGEVRVISVEPGNETILAGQSLNFIATIETPNNKIVTTQIAMTFASGKLVTYPMSVFGADNNKYRYQLATVAEDLDYIITAGDSQSEKFHVTVLPKIHLLGFKVDGVPPA